MIPKQRLPWLTILFVAINLGLAVMVTLGAGGLAEQYGFRASSPSLVNAFVSLFLHWNVLHLLANMLFLAAAGAAVEQSVGALRFAMVYLIGGLVGVGMHWLLYRSAGNDAVLIGASGCVAACIGYAVVRFANERIELGRGMRLPIWFFGALWIVLQVTGFFVRLGDSTGGVAFAAHLGGLGFGVLMSVLLKAPAAAELAADHASLQTAQDRSPAATLRAALDVLERHANDAKALAQAADAAQSLGETAQETSLRLRQVPSEPGTAFDRLASLGALGEVPELDRMKAVRTLTPEVQFKVLHSIAMKEGSPERPNALLELAQLDPAGPWARALQREFPMHPATDLARARGVFP